MTVYIILILSPLIYLIILANEKIKHLRRRENKTRLSIIFHNYENEKKEIYKKNPFETFRYARVTILGEEKTVRLNDNGAFIFQNLLNKNETVDVFWYGGELHLWYPYQEGLFIYLPSKWPFVK